jgi:hypothetical protein
MSYVERRAGELPRPIPPKPKLIEDDGCPFCNGTGCGYCGVLYEMQSYRCPECLAVVEKKFHYCAACYAKLVLGVVE